MKISTKITTSAIGAFALIGLLAGCDKKASDTAATPTATASAFGPNANDDAAVTGATDDANRASGDGMSNNMGERHRQEMGHESMRHGSQMGPMGQMGPGGTPTATESPAARP